MSAVIVNPPRDRKAFQALAHSLSCDCLGDLEHCPALLRKAGVQ